MGIINRLYPRFFFSTGIFASRLRLDPSLCSHQVTVAAKRRILWRHYQISCQDGDRNADCIGQVARASLSIFSWPNGSGLFLRDPLPWYRPIRGPHATTRASNVRSWFSVLFRFEFDIALLLNLRCTCTIECVSIDHYHVSNSTDIS